MCFLKNVLQKESSNAPSAFKKVKQENVEHSSDQNSDQVKQTQSTNSFKIELPEVPQSSMYQGQLEHSQLTFLQDVLQFNNSVMWTLLEKSQTMEKIIFDLNNEISELKKNVTNSGSKNPTTSIPLNLSTKEDRFIAYQFGDNDYKYKIVLDEPLSHQLYKQRNFNLKIKLVDANDNPVVNSNPLPVTLCAYTSEEEPQVILTNKLDQPMFKGNCQNELFNGVSEFRKIHLREVSSYYDNGWIYLVVYVKTPSFNYNLKESSVTQVVDHNLVKPLVISDVIIRAKKK